jgi:hypothetical protein
MKQNGPPTTTELEKGQLWRLKGHYIYIVALLDSSIQFKLMDSPDEKRERTLTSDLEIFLGYLFSRRGRLLKQLPVSD